jgi:hypothetical protein
MKLRSQPAAFQTRAQSRGLVGPGGAPISREKVVVGYPAGGSITVPFSVSRERLMLYEMQKEPDGRLLAAAPYVSGLYIANNRNILAKSLLATPYEWLLQIDTDIEFPHTLLETMVELAGNDKKVLAASVPLGTAMIFGNSEQGAGFRNGFPTCAFRCDGPGVWTSLPEVPAEPIAVDGVATACILIHRSVFEEIARRGGQCWFDHIYEPKGEPDGEDWSKVESISLGEDIAFCVRAALAGFPSYCVTIPGLRHHKVAPQTHDMPPQEAPAALEAVH